MKLSIEGSTNKISDQSIDGKFMYGIFAICCFNFFIPVIPFWNNGIVAIGIYIFIWISLSVYEKVKNNFEYEGFRVKKAALSFSSFVASLVFIGYVYKLSSQETVNLFDILFSWPAYPWEINYNHSIFTENNGRLAWFLVGALLIGIYNSLYFLGLVRKPIQKNEEKI